LGDLDEECGDEASERRLVREDAGNPGAALEFLINPFEWVGGTKTLLMSQREGMH
jgi:hypothetical protein